MGDGGVIWCKLCYYGGCKNKQGCYLKAIAESAVSGLTCIASMIAARLICTVILVSSRVCLGRWSTTIATSMLGCMVFTTGGHFECLFWLTGVGESLFTLLLVVKRQVLPFRLFVDGLILNTADLL